MNIKIENTAMASILKSNKIDEFNPTCEAVQYALWLHNICDSADIAYSLFI